jgi:hypothetical protein
MDDLIDSEMSDGETIRLKVRPNEFVYALKASRFPLLERCPIRVTLSGVG